MKLLVYKLSEENLAQVKAVAPELEIINAKTEEELLGAMPEAEIYLPGPRDPKFFAGIPMLKWVHMVWAGIDHSPFLSVLPQEVTATNSAGVFAVPIAEHAMAMILAFSRGIQFCARWPKEKVWGEGNYWERFQPHLLELQGATLGIVGYGGIGQATAERAKSFGMRILAERRRPQGSDGIADEMWGPERLDDLLRESDYILISAPLTNETRGLIGARELGLMKPTAVIVNVARGAVIDQEALISALKEDKLRGAALDVTTPEPLPFDSPLWELDNVLITPHVSGSSPRTWERQFNLFLENLSRYVAGERLLNVVDREAGY